MHNVVLERMSQSRSVVWSAATQSAAVQVESGSAFSLFLPSGFVGTALTVESLEADGTWAQFYHDVSGTSTLLSIPVTAGKRNHLPMQLFSGLHTIRFVSGSSETAIGTLWMAG